MKRYVQTSILQFLKNHQKRKLNNIKLQQILSILDRGVRSECEPKSIILTPHLFSSKKFEPDSQIHRSPPFRDIYSLIHRLNLESLPMYEVSTEIENGDQTNKSFHVDLVNYDSFGWEGQYYEYQHKELVIPTVRPAKFLEDLDLSNEIEIAIPHYKPKPIHVFYPFESMLKLIPFQVLSRAKSNKVLENKLKDNVDGCLESLGFRSDRIPTRRTISRFFYEYMGIEGHRNLMDILVIRLKEIMDNRGIPFGVRIGIDSTPLETLHKDTVGVINGHYYEKQHIGKMVKVHTVVCVDTGIPIASVVVDGNSYDGDFLLPLLAKVYSLGFRPKELYGDNHYGTTNNWAKASRFYGLKCYFNLAENATYREDGTPDKIQWEYQKYRYYHDFVIQDQVGFEEMLDYMISQDKAKCVGAYYRNEFWKVRERSIEEYKAMKSDRNLCENLHSILKEQLDFDKNLSRKGWKNIEIYTRQYLITLIIVALIKAENGEIGGFVKVVENIKANGSV